MLIYLIIGIIIAIVQVCLIEKTFGKSFIDTWDEQVDICEKVYNKPYDEIKRDLKNEENVKKKLMVMSIVVIILLWPIAVIKVLKDYVSREI